MQNPNGWCLKALYLICRNSILIMYLINSFFPFNGFSSNFTRSSCSFLSVNKYLVLSLSCFFFFFCWFWSYLTICVCIPHLHTQTIPDFLSPYHIIVCLLKGIRSRTLALSGLHLLAKWLPNLNFIDIISCTI